MTVEQPCSYAVGDRVLVTYDSYGQPYSGEITEVVVEIPNGQKGKTKYTKLWNMFISQWITQL